jgi:HAD superfamily hydrolase (TIGR01549 family)
MTSQRPAVKAVLFDLDDTLFDHLHSTRQGLRAVCEAYPGLLQYSHDALFAAYTELLDEVHLRVLAGQLTIEEGRAERFRRFFLLHAPETANLERVVAHAADLHREHYQANRQVVAGVLPLLEYLHQRVRIAVVTNNIVAEQIDKLRYLHLEHLVDELVTSEETGFIKPDPGIFRVALQRLGCRAGEVVMVGDSWKADIAGAFQASIRAIWLNRTGLPCPDPQLARELTALEPLDEVVKIILDLN